jgi:hypothetical protein
LVFLLALSVRLALLPWLPIPQPAIHDEFSYLLAADTYAHGRLANPPHPFWRHFETFQELQQPTYASKYQPLQGLALAFGEKLFNQPWAGVLLTSSLMCAAVCWMLEGWISPEWALLGALLFTLRVGIVSYWMNSYEGGAVPAIGGALALGAVARIWKRRDFRHSATWALGLAILMHSRPYDAAVLALASAALLAWLLRGSIFSARFVRPAALVLALSLAAVAYTDYRVTGSALTLPYQAHDRQYAVASMFMVLPLRPEPVYRHAVMRDFWAGWNVGQWKDSRTAPVAQFFGKAYILSDFFFGLWPLAAPLLLWPFVPKTTEEQATLALGAACLVSLALLIGVLPHYAAAFAGVFYLRLLQSLARLGAWRKPVGPVLAAAMVALFACAGRDTLSTALAGRAARFGVARDAMDRTLAHMPGKQLALVRYQPGHYTQEEWVFNSADIDSQRVVWAREMDPEQDRPFLQYFHDRQVWLVEPDRTPPRLTPYPMMEPAREALR